MPFGVPAFSHQAPQRFCKPGTTHTTGAAAKRPIWETVDNDALKKLPNHLKQFIVDQRYDDYTAQDHAVWRYIMKQAIYFLRENAHRLYFKGLLETGIDLNAIPRITDMNRILGAIGWGAVAVDGFIPPAAFMEFQAYKVLVIACEMRQIHHIEYTPAPDIVHEAAGHAPIIVDHDYAAYLQRFGAIGAKAMSSRKDFELYEAIRHLSIIKEVPGSDPEAIKHAEQVVAERQKNLGAPSEMARLSRLHWWTVEYGLIGNLMNPKIYGAGLLSSIGESGTCLDEHVKKIRYSIDAQNYPFDITTQQPQLFVVEEFDELTTVLEQFADQMAFRVGGKYGIDAAIECNNVSTVELSSGIQVTGTFTEALFHNQQPSFIKSTSASALAYQYTELPGHDKGYHRDGFSTPIGRLAESTTPLENMNGSQLEAMNIREGAQSQLIFESGITVNGCLEKIERKDGKNILFVFTNCTVMNGSTTLFRPEWGAFDMAIGEKVVSVFNGAADKDAYEQIALVGKERSIKVTYDSKQQRLHGLYKQVRDAREGRAPVSVIPEIWNSIQRDYPDDWLLAMEMCELLTREDIYPEQRVAMRSWLEAKLTHEPELTKLIKDGFNLIDLRKFNPKD